MSYFSTSAKSRSSLDESDEAKVEDSNIKLSSQPLTSRI